MGVRQTFVFGLIVVALAALSGIAINSVAAGTDTEVPGPVRLFIGDGYGRAHPDAPAKLSEFGRLAGLWHVETELKTEDGNWVDSAPGIWAWKFVLDGFAVSDLFYQGAQNLPIYMANLNRDYMLNATRIYDTRAKTWLVAWFANGAGETPGADFGTFTAVWEDDELIMSSPPGDDDGYGYQRVVFHDFSDDFFRWKSEYSADQGNTWTTVMRIRATRVE